MQRAVSIRGYSEIATFFLFPSPQALNRLLLSIIGIWDVVRALLHRRDFIGPGYDTATSQVYKASIPVFCVFRCFQRPQQTLGFRFNFGRADISMIIRELRFPVHHTGPILINKLFVAVGIATTPFSLAVRPLLDDGDNSRYNT